MSSLAVWVFDRCLSPILFSLYLNDIEEQFRNSHKEGIDIDMIKIFLLLYADDSLILPLIFKTVSIFYMIIA